MLRNASGSAFRAVAATTLIDLEHMRVSPSTRTASRLRHLGHVEAGQPLRHADALDRQPGVRLGDRAGALGAAVERVALRAAFRLHARWRGRGRVAVR